MKRWVIIVAVALAALVGAFAAGRYVSPAPDEKTTVTASQSASTGTTTADESKAARTEKNTKTVAFPDGRSETSISEVTTTLSDLKLVSGWAAATATKTETREVHLRAKYRVTGLIGYDLTNFSPRKPDVYGVQIERRIGKSPVWIGAYGKAGQHKEAGLTVGVEFGK